MLKDEDTKKYGCWIRGRTISEYWENDYDGELTWPKEHPLSEWAKELFRTYRIKTLDGEETGYVKNLRIDSARPWTEEEKVQQFRKALVHTAERLRDWPI